MLIALSVNMFVYFGYYAVTDVDLSSQTWMVANRFVQFGDPGSDNLNLTKGSAVSQIEENVTSTEGTMTSDILGLIFFPLSFVLGVISIVFSLMFTLPLMLQFLGAPMPVTLTFGVLYVAAYTFAVVTFFTGREF
jgi:hypothetical protein